MSQQQLEVLAQGRTAEVQAWKEGWVLKLFFDWFPEDAVRYEAMLAQAIHAAGLPVPEVGEIVEWDGRLGLPYERLAGHSMLEELLGQPETVSKNARILAELQAAIHEIESVPGVPGQREKLKHKIRGAKGLSENQVKRLIEALGELPDGARLCHGDLHPANVILTLHGPVVIDWIDAALGNPSADVARTDIIMSGIEAGVSSANEALADLARRFLTVYKDRYFDLVPGRAAEFGAWRSIVAGGRMNEGIEEQQEWLLVQVRAGLR